MDQGARADLLNRATALCRLALAFGRVERVTRHEDGQRSETDTDHTVMLGLIACDLAERLAPKGFAFDRGLIAQFALVHDITETYAGDTQTLVISDAGRVAKAAREAAARARIAEEFGADSWLVRSIDAYEAQDTPEARFVRVIDKVLPQLTHAANGAVAAKAITDLDGFVESDAAQLAKLRRTCGYDYTERALDLLSDAMIASERAYAASGAKNG